MEIHKVSEHMRDLIVEVNDRDPIILQRQMVEGDVYVVTSKFINLSIKYTSDPTIYFEIFTYDRKTTIKFYFRPSVEFKNIHAN